MTDLTAERPLAHSRFSFVETLANFRRISMDLAKSRPESFCQILAIRAASGVLRVHP